MAPSTSSASRPVHLLTTPSSQTQGVSSLVSPANPSLSSAHFVILDAAANSNEPLTLTQFAYHTGMARHDIQVIVRTLCGLRLLSRLNTIIASYVAAR